MSAVQESCHCPSIPRLISSVPFRKGNNFQENKMNRFAKGNKRFLSSILIEFLDITIRHWEPVGTRTEWRHLLQDVQPSDS